MQGKYILRAGIGIASSAIIIVGAPMAFADGSDPVTTPTPEVTTMAPPVVNTPPTPAKDDCTPKHRIKSPARGDGKIMPEGAMRNTEAAKRRTERFAQWVKDHPELAKKLAAQRAEVHARQAAKGHTKGGKALGHCKTKVNKSKDGKAKGGAERTVRDEGKGLVGKPATPAGVTTAPTTGTDEKVRTRGKSGEHGKGKAGAVPMPMPTTE